MRHANHSAFSASTFNGFFRDLLVRERRTSALSFVRSDRAQLTEIVPHVRDGRLRTNIGAVATLGDAVGTFNAKVRRSGKTIIRVRPE